MFGGIDPSSPAATIISIALMLFLGFAMTRLTKLVKLPTVTAYILVGILIGPYCLNWIPKQMIAGMDFLSDIALAFIAFGTGEFFRFSALKKNGGKVVVITLTEAIAATALVFVVTRVILRLSFAFSIVLAALAAATAPASTMMTIRQTRSKGDFVDTLLQVIALDNIVSLLSYSIAISVALASMGEASIQLGSIFLPVATNIGVLLLGGIFGFFMKLLLSEKRSKDNRLIVSISLLFAFCSICTLLGISPLLGCMSMGTVYINLTDDDKLFKQLNYFSPPLLLLFFVRSGLNFRLDALAGGSAAVGTIPLLVISLAYFFTRLLGKYGGSFLGCLFVGKPKNVRNYLGMALIPQASVAIGLAALGARAFGGEAGEALETVILTAAILYELVGPALAKLSLYLSGSYSDKLEDLTTVAETAPDGTQKSAAELLADRIQLLQAELPDHVSIDEENEQAFLEAAEEQQAAILSHLQTPNRKRRHRIL